jgi:hypothetical protein
LPPPPTSGTGDDKAAVEGTAGAAGSGSPQPSAPGGGGGGGAFDAALLEASTQFFFQCCDLPLHHRLRMLRVVSELCGRWPQTSSASPSSPPTGQPPPATPQKSVVKDPTLFEMIGNPLGDALAALSTFVMRDTQTVTKISLGNTNMTDSGCAQLALALEYPRVRHLQGIFLGGNFIHGQYAVLLLQALIESKFIDANHEMVVDLNGNPLFRSRAEATVFMGVVRHLQSARPKIKVEFPNPGVP